METIEELKKELEKQINKSDMVFLIGHNSPDFDSIGSCIALATLVESKGKKAYIIVDDEDFKIEPGVKKIIDANRGKFRIVKKDKFIKKATGQTLLIMSDVNKKNMISIGDYLDRADSIIVIDHHTEDQNTVNTALKFISQKISSASEAVAKVLLKSNEEIPQDVANFLLAGISLDTNGFKQNTTSETHDVAEKLLLHGADIDCVNNLFLEEFESYCRISNLIINGTIIRKYSESLLSPIQVSFTLNRNMPGEIYQKEDYAKAADLMMKFNGVDASFALGYVEPGVVHISARSGKRVNVGKVLSELNGGGNTQCAGGRVETDDILAVEKELMEKVPSGISDEEDVFTTPEIIKIKQIKRQDK